MHTLIVNWFRSQPPGKSAQVNEGVGEKAKKKKKRLGSYLRSSFLNLS